MVTLENLWKNFEKRTNKTFDVDARLNNSDDPGVIDPRQENDNIAMIKQ